MVAGGANQARVLNVVEVFEPATGEWQEMPPMRHARAYAHLFVHQGSLVVAGGRMAREGPSMVVEEVEMYSPQTRRWCVVHKVPAVSGAAVHLPTELVSALCAQ